MVETPFWPETVLDTDRSWQLRMCGIDNEKRDILCSEVWSEAWWLVVAMFIQIVGVQTLDLRMTNKIHQSSHSE